MGAAGEPTLEFTPTWVVALVCSAIVIISLIVERFLHRLGKTCKKNNKKPLYEALQIIKEELMLLGFISLLLTVFQDSISKICIPKEMANQWLPCKKEKNKHSLTSIVHSLFSYSSHEIAINPVGSGRHLAESSAGSGYCTSQGKVPLLSNTALHHLHIFIFVLAVVHVTFCALTILFGMAKIRQWKKWEVLASTEDYDIEEVRNTKFTHVQEHDFIRKRFQGLGNCHSVIGWSSSFFKQFYGSVNRSDYITLRLGFVVTHCSRNPKFDFHRYMMRTLEADFKKVVGISWFLWLFVIFFLLLNVYGWHMYFWLGFIPLILMLAVGTKLEHIMTELAHEVAEKHIAVEGDLVVKPSDDHFWFHKPRVVLTLIHTILFQNSFELAFFFWSMLQYGFDSCFMSQIAYSMPRLALGVFIQFVCSYSTLPLYAIVTQMGSSYKKAIFEEHIRENLIIWARAAKKRTAVRNAEIESATHLSRSQSAIEGKRREMSFSKLQFPRSLSSMTTKIYGSSRK